MERWIGMPQQPAPHRCQKTKPESKEDSYQKYHRIKRPSIQSLWHKENSTAKKPLIAPHPPSSPSCQELITPPFPTANMGKLCCSQEDDEPAFNLLGLLVTIVLALLLMMLCTPPRRRRCVAYYPCC